MNSKFTAIVVDVDDDLMDWSATRRHKKRLAHWNAALELCMARFTRGFFTESEERRSSHSLWTLEQTHDVTDAIARKRKHKFRPQMLIYAIGSELVERWTYYFHTFVIVKLFTIHDVRLTMVPGVELQSLNFTFRFLECFLPNATNQRDRRSLCTFVYRRIEQIYSTARGWQVNRQSYHGFDGDIEL